MAYEQEGIIWLSGNEETMMFIIVDKVPHNILGDVEVGDLV